MSVTITMPLMVLSMGALGYSAFIESLPLVMLSGFVTAILMVVNWIEPSSPQCLEGVRR